MFGISQSEFIFLEIIEVDIRDHDTLVIYNQADYKRIFGIIPLKSSLIAKFSGEVSDKRIVLSKINDIYVEFKSNHNNARNRFHIYYLINIEGQLSL